MDITKYLFLFTALHTSVSYTNEKSIDHDKIHHNYAGLVLKMLGSIPTHLSIHNNDYILRGVIVFNKPEKCDVIISSGHYIGYAHRSNGDWEVFDDTKEKIIKVSEKKVVNVEFLIYTI